MNNVGVEPELIKKMIKIINKNKAKISILEEELKNMKKKKNKYEKNNNKYPNMMIKLKQLMINVEISI